MTTPLHLDDVRRAWEAKDPELVQYVEQIATQPEPQPVPLYGGASAEGEQREERLALEEAEAGEGLAAHAHLEGSEQADAEWRRGGGWSGHGPSVALLAGVC